MDFISVAQLQTKELFQVDQLLTIDSVKNRLNCSRACAHQIVQRGQLKAVKITTGEDSKHPLVRWKESELEKFIDAHST